MAVRPVCTMVVMMRFLRRRDRAEEDSTDPAIDAAARAEAFWRTWHELLPEVNAALGDGVPQRFDHPLAEAAAAIHPNLVISVEHGENAIYALVLSAQADPELRVYTDAWKAAAPAPDSVWEYHDAIPPVPDPAEVTINLHGEQYALADVRVAPQVGNQEGLVDVAVYHPGFAGLGDAEQQALTFLPLDAALGERLAADRIGRVETAENEPQGAIDLLEFRDLVRDFDHNEGISET